MNRELMLRKESTIREMLENPETKRRIKQALPAHIDEAQFLRIVLSVILSDEKLMECTPRSLLICVMAIAQLGLSPIPALGQAYIVPFGREAKFIPGYRGYLLLARRSREIKKVNAQVVYENDDFILEYGTDEKLKHKPAEGERGRERGSYVIFWFNDGTPDFDYMTTEDINKVRDQFSQQPQGMMWKDSWPEAAKKTVIKRKIKLIPLAVEEMHKASALEDQAYRGESQFDMVFPEADARPELLAGKDFYAALHEYHGKAGIKEYDQGKLADFIRITAEANEVGIDEVKQGALQDLHGFWGQFERWSEGKGKEVPIEDFPFAKLKRTGLLAWEKEHRDELPAMDKATQTAFMEKWKRIMGTDYPEGIDGGSEQPQKEPASGEQEVQAPGDDTDEFVTCPNTQEEMKISYCNTHCKQREGCPVFG